MNELDNNLDSIISRVAELHNIANKDLSYELKASKGNGFSSNMYFSSLTNKKSNEHLSVAIKKAHTKKELRNALNAADIFGREIHFYSKIFPAFDNFQKRKNVKKPFSSVPRFLFANKELMNETVVLEDVRKQGFHMMDSTKLLNDEEIDFAFRTYGKFHALSFAYRDQHPEEFQYLSKGLLNFAVPFVEIGNLIEAIKNVCTESAQYFDCEEEDQLLNKYNEFCDNCQNLFYSARRYEGRYKAIVHGDCWTNNILFKHDEGGKLEAVKLIDFQQVNQGSPVEDLSYFLYASGSKQSFGNMDNLLRAYHESFSEFCQQLGSDPEKLFPLSALKEDWKRCAHFGLLMGMLLTRIKLVDKKDIERFTDGDGDTNLQGSVDENTLRERTKDLIYHAYEIGLF